MKETLEADNYEDQLSAPEAGELNAMENYAKLKFIDFFGTDKQGQHIFAIYACRLPDKKDLNGTTFIEYVFVAWPIIETINCVVVAPSPQIYHQTNGTLCTK